MKLLFLGTAQDAGVPQISCYCRNCMIAREFPSLRRYGPSIALYDEKKLFCYLVDASPDIKDQIDLLKESSSILFETSKKFPVSGIFLTHAHFGHISGLWSLGKECLDAKKIKTYCSPNMYNFLSKNHPFQDLVVRDNIELIEIKQRVKHPIEDFKVEIFSVPHRNENADNVGYFISHDLKIVYLPDLDYWTEESIIMIEKADIAIIDGTFYSRNEISRYEDVPHPPIKESMELLKSIDTEIYFTHFNHTNPILRETTVARRKVEMEGFKVAYDGYIIDF
ncbi:MAG: MBL fold metallo-hydrolase [Asgard group archaeon]|nr:MBL fold metallo-hydrolase [Asgard group archaeon]